jgi:hypothetical protein
MFKTQRNFPVRCFVDNKSLVDALHSTNTIDDNRLKIDLAVLKNMMERGELESVSWIESSQQLANSMTKRGASSRQLLAALGGY